MKSEQAESFTIPDKLSRNKGGKKKSEVEVASLLDLPKVDVPPTTD